MTETGNKIAAAFKFFEEAGHSVHQIVVRGRRKAIKEPCILEGMVRVWERVQAGEDIKPISLVWVAWEEAKNCQGEEYVKWCLNRKDYMAQIERLERSVTVREAIIYGLIALYLSSAGLIYWIYFHV